MLFSSIATIWFHSYRGLRYSQIRENPQCESSKHVLSLTGSHQLNYQEHNREIDINSSTRSEIKRSGKFAACGYGSGRIRAACKHAFRFENSRSDLDNGLHVQKLWLHGVRHLVFNRHQWNRSATNDRYAHYFRRRTNL